MIRSRFSMAVAALGASVMLSGCLGGLLPEPAPAPNVYRLVTPTPSQQKDSDAAIVRVDNVSSARTFATRDVLVMTGAGSLSAASGARWADSIPEMVQDAALTELSRSSRYISVLPVAGARSDLRLHIDLRDFSAQYDQGPDSAPMAKVHVYATVSQASTRQFIGSFDAVGTQRAGANRVSSIVDAQSLATREALGEVVAWMETLRFSPSKISTRLEN